VIGLRRSWLDPKQLLKTLLDFSENEKDTIPPKRISKLKKKCIGNEYFNEKKAKNASLATLYLYYWVQAMYDYYQIFVKTQPLRDKLLEQEEILAVKMAELAEKKHELEVINQKIAGL